MRSLPGPLGCSRPGVLVPPGRPGPHRPGSTCRGTGAPGGRVGATDAEAGMLSAEASSAICVQKLDDSRNSAIHTKYRISLRSSSLREPRYPLLRVVIGLMAARSGAGALASERMVKGVWGVCPTEWAGRQPPGREVAAPSARQTLAAGPVQLAGSWGCRPQEQTPTGSPLGAPDGGFFRVTS